MFFRSLVLASISAIISSAGALEYTNFTSFNDKNYNLSWFFNSSENVFYFKTEVKAVGWIAFGVSRLLAGTEVEDTFSRNTMDSYDIAVGGVDSGVSYLWDALTNGLGRLPPRDEQQDWNLTSASETNGITKLEFNRKLDTGDKDDNKITPGVRYFVWAYHSTQDARYNFTTSSQKHTYKGHQEVTLIAETRLRPPPDVTPSPATTAGTNKAAPTTAMFLTIAMLLLYK